MLARNLPKHNHRRRRQNKRNRLIIPVLILVIVTAGAFYLVKNYQAESKTPTASKQVTKTVAKVIKKPVEIPRSDIAAEINKIIAANPNVEISVALVDLETGQKTVYGSQRSFLGASTTKLITAISTFREIEKGNTKLTTPMAGYTVQWHLKQMINQSNNNSWDLLMAKVGYSKLSTYAKAFGAESFKFSNNSVTASDMADLLTNLYNGKLITEANRTTLYSYMVNTNNENLIAAGIPEGVTFYHKYGDYASNLHDAAIVKAKRPFALVVYTYSPSGMTYENRADIISQIAKKAYLYENE